MKWTIRKKFLLSYFILFTLVAIFVQQVMKDSLAENSLAVIENDMKKLQYTTREYSKQFAQIHLPKEDLFEESGVGIAQELSKLQTQSVAIYDRQGQFVYEAVPIDQQFLVENQVYQMDSEQASAPELQAAFANKASFTRQDLEGGTLIYFAYPVYIDNEFLGVLRFTSDYTAMIKRNNSVLRSFTLLIASLFIGVFVISLFVTTRIIQPLLRLTEATKLVATGDYQQKVEVHSKDEIEVLANSFNDMQHSIKLHIDRVEQEKDKVLILEKMRTSFFNNITHELKTPLTTISGYAQIIGDPTFDDPEFLHKATQKIRLESDRMNRMVIDLIELSKSETSIVSKELKPIHLLPLIISVVEDMNIEAKRQQMTIEIEGVDHVILGNQDELQQIFINLLDNAIKYGIANTTIHVVLADSVVTVSNASERVPEEIRAHVFDPFICTKGIGSSGLGLTIVKQLVTKYNGMISFEYKQGKVEVSINFLTWQQVGNN